jgi:hypothetical protein
MAKTIIALDNDDYTFTDKIGIIFVVYEITLILT